LAAYRDTVDRSPSAFASLLAAADFAAGPSREIAIVGPLDDAATRALLRVARERYLPNRVIEAADAGAVPPGRPLLRDKTAVGGKPTAYVCRAYACQAPVTDPEALAAA